MPLSKIFWIAIILTLTFLALYTTGRVGLEVVISFLIIDIIIIEVNRLINYYKMKGEIKEGVVGKMENVEKICSNIVYKLETFPRYEIHSIENKIIRHKSELKEEFKDSLDKIAKKAIENENKLMQLRRTLAAAVASFDERIKGLESTPEETLEEEIFK